MEGSFFFTRNLEFNFALDTKQIPLFSFSTKLMITQPTISGWKLGVEFLNNTTCRLVRYSDTTKWLGCGWTCPSPCPFNSCPRQCRMSVSCSIVVQTDANSQITWPRVTCYDALLGPYVRHAPPFVTPRVAAGSCKYPGLKGSPSSFTIREYLYSARKLGDLPLMDFVTEDEET